MASFPFVLSPGPHAASVLLGIQSDHSKELALCSESLVDLKFYVYDKLPKKFYPDLLPFCWIIVAVIPFDDPTPRLL